MTAEAVSTPKEEKPVSWAKGGALPAHWQLLYGFAGPASLLIAHMWRVRSFTIDDAYISFRYARNFSRGLGLVYNPGERIEGYTNFLWTVLLGVGLKLGIDPVGLAKVMGAASALGTLWFVYRLGDRMRPYTNMPSIATWLLSSTIVFSGYAVFGLETALFSLLVTAGVFVTTREEDAAKAMATAPEGQTEPKFQIPWSGVLFALAGLTRPEAPLFIGLTTLFLGRAMFTKRNVMRWAIFVAVIGAHMLWRHSYYGTWLPNTLGAKTGNLEGQIRAGRDYLWNYARMGGFFLALAPIAIVYGILKKNWLVLCVATITGLMLAYVVLVGGDWMPYFRFLAPIEPFLFLLVDVVFRWALDRRAVPMRIGAGVAVIVLTVIRLDALKSAQRVMHREHEHFWNMAAGGTSRWLLEHTEPGQIAMGDIGEIGWKTDYPVLDLLGLVDPVIAKLPGGYTQKLGPGFTKRFFDAKPRYALIISAQNDCAHPSVPGSQVLYHHPRFAKEYALKGRIPLDRGFAWCIYERPPVASSDAAPGTL